MSPCKLTNQAVVRRLMHSLYHNLSWLSSLGISLIIIIIIILNNNNDHFQHEYSPKALTSALHIRRRRGLHVQKSSNLMFYTQSRYGYIGAIQKPNKAYIYIKLHTNTHTHTHSNPPPPPPTKNNNKTQPNKQKYPRCVCWCPHNYLRDKRVHANPISHIATDHRQRWHDLECLKKTSFVDDDVPCRVFSWPFVLCLYFEMMTHRVYDVTSKWTFPFILAELFVTILHTRHLTSDDVRLNVLRCRAYLKIKNNSRDFSSTFPFMFAELFVIIVCARYATVTFLSSPCTSRCHQWLTTMHDVTTYPCRHHCIHRRHLLRSCHSFFASLPAQSQLCKIISMKNKVGYNIKY